jgi:hypothetical protein
VPLEALLLSGQRLAAAGLLMSPSDAAGAAPGPGGSAAAEVLISVDALFALLRYARGEM